MCFAKSAPSAPPPAPVVVQEPVVRKSADASITKNSQDNRNKGAFLQNVKTDVFGLDDNAKTQKKTLLGE